jgi:DNA ligase-1
MSNFAKAIQAAEQTGTRVVKIAALSGFNAEEKRLVFETFNPFRVFNVKKFDAPANYAVVDHSSFQPFFDLLDALHSRELSGNLAKRELTRVMAMYTKETATYLERVLKKDLKCGFSGDSFEKIYQDLKIPRFDLMLATKIEENAVTLTEAILAKKYNLTFPLIAESKYDGNRLIAFVSHGKVGYFARSGKDSDHLIGLFDDELIAMEKEVGQPIVVDGEVLASSFAQTMKSKGSKNDDAKSALKFWAFDMMTRADWDNQSNDIVQEVRSAYLQTILQTIKATKIVKSKSKVCHSIKELRDFYAEVLLEGTDPETGEKNGLGEGLIVKDPNGKYEWDRSKSWRKWKPVLDLDLTITGYELGSKGTRLEKTVGKVLLEGQDENGNKVKARCGSGLTDKIRADMLANWSKYQDKTAKIEAQELTLAQGSNVYSARFPVFCNLRNDK